MIETKVWGSTELLWEGNNVELHKIIINRGGYCSKHVHQFKHNLFYVEDGVLEIERWDDNMCNVTRLHSGESTVARPGEYHRFEALENTIAFELYYVSIEKPDILREIVGGMRG